MRDEQDTQWSDTWVTEAFERFFDDLYKKYDGVSYSFAYTLWNQAIAREAVRGWNVSLDRIHDTPKEGLSESTASQVSKLIGEEPKPTESMKDLMSRSKFIKRGDYNGA